MNKYGTLSFYAHEGELAADVIERALAVAWVVFQEADLDPVVAQASDARPMLHEMTGDDQFVMLPIHWAQREVWHRAERAACTAAGVDEGDAALTNYPELVAAEKREIQRRREHFASASSKGATYGR